MTHRRLLKSGRLVLVVSVLLVSIIAVACDVTPQPTPAPAVKYQRYAPSLYNSDNTVIIDYSYLMRNTLLPVTIRFGDETVIIKEVTVRKIEENGFSVDALVSRGGQESSIGFSRLNRPIKGENGCAWESDYYPCTPVGADLIVKEWEREPTSEEKARNVFQVHYYRSIDILEIDYDVTSNEWNYLKFALGETKIEGVVVP